MSRAAILALGLVALTAALSVPASAGQYYPGGYAPYPPYGGYPTPCCAYPAPVVVAPYGPPPQVYAQPRLPPPPVVNWHEGPRYYQPSGYGNVGSACYDQYVRIPDGRGGWSWGLKSSCDQR